MTWEAKLPNAALIDIAIDNLEAFFAGRPTNVALSK